MSAVRARFGRDYFGRGTNEKRETELIKILMLNMMPGLEQRRMNNL